MAELKKWRRKALSDPDEAWGLIDPSNTRMLRFAKLCGFERVRRMPLADRVMVLVHKRCR